MPAPPPRPLDAIFRPRSVAVVGASRARDSIGWAILDNLISAGFTGAIYPVNPKATAVHSLKCYPSIGAIPDPIDLAVIAVPRAAVEPIVEECLARGVRGLVVITAGFAETGAVGREVEARIRDKVRAAGARMVGPNCMGVANTDPDIALDATFAPIPARRGSIGFVSQSGALGVAILNHAADLGIGLTQFISMGNKADVSGNDLVEHWEGDPETRVIAMYLESFGNPRRFTEIAKRVSRKKPILMVKSGRTAEGARAASSHTGALLAGADVTVSAFLAQCGVLRAATIEELFDVARALDRGKLPAGDRVAVVTNAGGPAIMATDALVDLGLAVPELAAATRAELAEFLPSTAALGNPVDMIASAGAEAYGRTLATVLADPAIDAALVIHVTPLLTNPHDVLEEIARVAAGWEKPVLAVMMANEAFYAAIEGRGDLPPVYRFPESAARALAQLRRYAQWRERPTDEAPAEFAVDESAARAALAAADAAGHLPPAAAFAFLGAIGVPAVATRFLGADRAALAGAAGEVGYPLVLKASASGLVHKSDVGAVALGIGSEGDLAAAAEAMNRRLADAGFEVDGWVVQEQARGGHEVIFGLATDARFGPVVMFGLGGKYVEVWNDVRFAVPPLAPSEARAVVSGLRGAKLLLGVRGEPAADTEVLVEILLRIAAAAVRFPEIVELDVNPFLAAPDRAAAKALDVRVRVATPTR